MCGRLFMNINPGQLRQIARCSVIRNPERSRTCFNMGPTHYIPCIRKQNLDNEQKNNYQNKSQINENKKMIDEKKEKENQQVTNNMEILNEDEGCVASDLYLKSKNLYSQVQNKSDEQTAKDKDQTDQKCFQETNDGQDQNGPLFSDRYIDFMYWGYQTEFQNIINIRSEEAEMKKTFKPLLKNNRCVILTQGYYEWTPDKIPFVFFNIEKDYMLICAIYSEETEQVMLLTRESFGKFDQVHHRMPVFIEEDEIELWLNPQNDYNEVLFKHLLKRDRKVYNEINSYRCSTNVNNIREQTIKCLMSYEEHKKELDKNGIAKFFKVNKVEEKVDDSNNDLSYYKKQLDIFQKNQTNELASQLNNITVEITENKQNQCSTQAESNNNAQLVNGNDNVNEVEKSHQLKNKSKQKPEINPLKRENVNNQEPATKQSSAFKKSSKTIKSTVNSFQEGLESFFQQKKSQKDSK